MQNITHSFHGIVKTTIIKLIHIKLIDNEYKYKSKNNVNSKKTSPTHNTNKCFEVIVKLNIIFITFSKKMGKKCYPIQQTKKQQKFITGKQYQILNLITSTTTFTKKNLKKYNFTSFPNDNKPFQIIAKNLKTKHTNHNKLWNCL